MNTIPCMIGSPGEGIKASLDNFDAGLRCAIPGVIETFNPDKQTATVTVAIAERVKIDGELYSAQIPTLTDVPVCFPTAGNFSLTFPVKHGDECLVVFADTCIDSWYQSGCLDSPDGHIATLQMSLRRHDLSDALAIVGIKSQPKKLSNYSTSSVQLRSDDGGTFVEITPSGEVNIVAPGNMNITSPKAMFNGDLETTGDVTVGTGASGVLVDLNGRTFTIQDGIVISIT